MAHTPSKYTCTNIIDFYDAHMPSCWKSVFKRYTLESELDLISKVVHKRVKESGDKIKIYPYLNFLFDAFFRVSPDKIKLIILGQDPYPSVYQGHPVAIGVAFGSDPYAGVQGSLRNIHKKLELEGYSPDKKDISLHKWSDQGILLLNTSLTIENGKIGSHLQLWRNFSIRLIMALTDELKRKVVWLLMGRKAQEHIPLIKNNKKHKLICTPHPSPMSADLFFSHGDIFRKVNKYVNIKW